MPSRRDRAAHSRPDRGRRIVAALSGLVIVVAALALLAIPLLGVPSDAQDAKADLTGAATALRAGDTAAARMKVENAREHVDAARGGAYGLGGDVWSAIPFLGTPVDDARHLVQALDDATSVAEIGVDLYPGVAGNQATLFRDQQVDKATLDRVLDGVRRAGDHLESADAELGAVEASTPIVGDTIAAQRDAAADQVEPLLDAYGKFEPMLGQLPAVLGFEGERSYLVAMLNPAELRYSGGAALTFAPMSWDTGKVRLGESVTVGNASGLSEKVRWRKVFGNPFHSRNARVANATFAPSWSVSGPELLRAWREARNKRHDGVLAVDVVALSRLVGASGGVTVPEYGKLTGANLVETLVGSYDDFYPDATAQDDANQSLIRVFQDKLFGGGDYITKARALATAANGRHFATYFADDEVQETFAAMGLDGDLAEPRGDYLAVFTQNRNGSKVDYWQRRSLALDVTLGEDGAATNRLDIGVHNDTTPYPFTVPDPGTGYFTRFSGLSLAAFLPAAAQVDEESLRSNGWGPEVEDYYDHAFVRQQLQLDPGAETTRALDYTVPDAAAVEDSGNLTYRLAVDPQGTVNPASLTVTVHLPEGYRATQLPEGWTAQGDAVVFRTDALESTQEWEISMAADD